MTTNTTARDVGPDSAYPEPSLLTITSTSPVPGVLVVTLRGELDLASAPGLDAQLRRAVALRAPHRLILDLSGLRFLGLQGIAVFERIRRRAGTARAGMALVGLPPAGERALRYTGVLDRFDRYPDVTTALAATRADAR